MKKIGFIAMALVLALGALGVGFAHWADTLVITETVETGELLAGFNELICAEMHTVPGDNTHYIGEFEGKDVGSYTCDLVDQIGTSPDFAYKKIVVTITNAYPCYWLHTTFKILNLGTIPGFTEELIITDPSGELTWDCGKQALVNASGEKVLEFEWPGNLLGWQIDPGDDAKTELDVHVVQPALENHQYTFEAKIVLVQWNKSIHYPQ